MTLRQSGAPGWAVYGALVTVQVLFGLQYLAAKVVLREIPPTLWAWIRVAGASIVLLALVVSAGRRLPRSPADLGRLAFYAIFGVVINQLCFIEGLSRTTATHSSILMTSVPVATLAIAVMLGRERFRLDRALAMIVAVFGVLLVIRPSAGDTSRTILVGDLLTLVNAVSYSLFLVISRRMLARVDALGATTLLMVFGTIGMTIPALLSAEGFDPMQLSATSLWLGLFMILFPTAGGYVMTYWALARVESSIVGFFVFLQPVIATGLAAVLLGERLTWATLAGAVLIFGAVCRVLLRNR